MKEQYEKNVGRQVAVTLKDGKKLKGRLLSHDDNGLVLESSKKEKIGGKKKKQLIVEQISLAFEEIEETKSVISFK